MGFYVRKSVKAGPFRFNLSGSGLGASVGVPGFRVGSGPRGNYVNIGAKGIYYRASGGRPTPHPVAPAGAVPELAYQPNAVVMEHVTGATSMELTPTGADDIVTQLNEASTRVGWGWPATAVAFVVGAGLMPWGLIVWALAVPVCWWIFLWDKSRKTVVLFYDVEDAPAEWFGALLSVWPWLTGSSRMWRTVASGNVNPGYQQKVNAGASSLVQRITAVASLDGPERLATNIAVPTVTAGKASLYFLPDRILLRENKHYADIAYSEMSVTGADERFIENPQGVPVDSQQVGQTWQYVNVNGGPDRRFANNPMLPIVLYSLLHVRSSRGLDWRIQISRAQAAASVAVTLNSARSFPGR